jgi:hypothetical protein
MCRGSVIYLLPVLLAGWHLGLVPALVAAVRRAVVRIFSSPYYSFYLAGRTDSQSAADSWWWPWERPSRQLRADRAPTKRGDGDLYAFSRRRWHRRRRPTSIAIEEHLASLVQQLVLFGAVADSDRDVK